MLTAAVLVPASSSGPAVQGTYQEKAKLPFVPGGEVSGTVIEVGSKVRSLKVGDKVSSV